MTYDVCVRMTVMSVEARSLAEAQAIVDQWIDQSAPALPGLACPSAHIESCDEVKD